MKRVIFFKAVVLVLVISGVGAQPALAYIDPNTGGQLFQLLAVLFAFFSAILLFLSSYIRMGVARTKRFIRSLSNKDSKEQISEEVAPESTRQISDAT